MESEAEVRQFEERRQRARGADAEKSGETLLDLAVVDHEPEVGGRISLTLAKRNRTLALPWHRLRVGSPVMLSPDGEPGETQFGVVAARSADSLQVAVEEWPDADRLRLDLSPDEVSRQRQAAALRGAAAARGRTAELRDVLLGDRPPQFDETPGATSPAGDRPPPQATSVEFAAALNPSQQEAVRFALAARDVALIHGPPGTGKTTAVVELIGQAVDRGQKVLACAPSNTAVDNLLERLIAAGRKVVRIGHPARVDRRLRDFTLDAQVLASDGMQVIREMLREAEILHRQSRRFTRAKPAPGEKQALRRDARRLQADARLFEQQIVEQVLDAADVVCATTTMNEETLGARRFDLAVIDEACQSTEPGCWIPVLRAERLVLAGDHRQLPPTVVSQQAAKEGFSISLMERLAELYGPSIMRRLDVQYRMHAEIMEFSSRQFYEGTLVAHPSAATHSLLDLPSVAAAGAAGPLVDRPVAFIDTAGADFLEELEPDGQSKRNPREAALVLHKARQLVEAGLPARDIAVIAPYAAQVRWLRERWPGDDLEIDTVDGFQGREKEAVLISCVRSNSTGEIGFLADIRRMNVALTRARRKLIVIGDSSTLGGHAFFADLLSWFETTGAYGSVWEEAWDGM